MDVTSGTRMARLPYGTPNAGARVPPNEAEDTFSSSEKGQVVDGGEGNGKEGEGGGLTGGGPCTRPRGREVITCTPRGAVTWAAAPPFLVALGPYLDPGDRV